MFGSHLVDIFLYHYKEHIQSFALKKKWILMVLVSGKSFKVKLCLVLSEILDVTLYHSFQQSCPSQPSPKFQPDSELDCSLISCMKRDFSTNIPCVTLVFDDTGLSLDV